MELKRDKVKIKQILKTLKSKNVEFLKLWFVDILGGVKSITVSHGEFEHALTEGMGFDGSSVEGFARIYESDLLAMPDLNTFAILPWETGEMKVAKMVCDILTPEGRQYEGDTRYILKKTLKEMKKMGFTSFKVGPELEYFYFKSDKPRNIPQIVDEGGYFDTIPVDGLNEVRRQTMKMLEGLGISVEYAHHEVAPSQHEIDLRYDDALKMADNVIAYKVSVKHIASQNGYYATFMPKPLFGQNGSGMHVHQSLFKGDRNVFYEKKSPNYLSPVAKHYIAGILKNVRALCAVTNQWVNSYKRLVPGYEAPVYIAWAKRNRSALVRVPQAKMGRPDSTRIECRFPDPACNPYLAFAVMLSAGLDGIKNKYPLPQPVEADIYKMDELERKAKKIQTLPHSLAEAIEVFSKSTLLKNTMGNHVFEKFAENKCIEWDNYRRQVTGYELKKYLPVL